MHIRVEAPHFVAAIEINGYGFVIDAAPILRWAIGKPWNEVRAYFSRKRGWSWQQMLRDGTVFPDEPERFAADRAALMNTGIISESLGERW